MNLEQIIAEVKKLEPKAAEEYFSQIKSRLHDDENHEPSSDVIYGFDIEIPEHLIKDVEKLCDEQKIPVYPIGKVILSVSDSYQKLLKREQTR